MANEHRLIVNTELNYKEALREYAFKNKTNMTKIVNELLHNFLKQKGLLV